MEKGALSDAAFPEFGKQVVLFLHNTSRLKDEPYPDLLLQKGGRGFPYLVFLDAEGTVVARHDAERTVEDFRATKARAETFLDLRKRASGGDRGARIEYLAARAELRQVTLEAVKAEGEALGALSPAEAAKVDQAFLTLEVYEIAAARQPAQVGPRLLALWKAGRVPSGGAARAYWSGLTSYAVENRDRALLAELLPRLRQDFGADRRWTPMIEGLEKSLEALSTGGGG